MRRRVSPFISVIVSLVASFRFAGVSASAVGPIIDHSDGFADHGDLAANGSTAFFDTTDRGTVARLTDSGWQRGSLFTSSRVDVRAFDTVFTFLLTPVSVWFADGITFTIQGNDPSALGGDGGWLGYGGGVYAYNSDFQTNTPGIPNSVAVKFDLYPNGATEDPLYY